MLLHILTFAKATPQEKQNSLTTASKATSIILQIFPVAVPALSITKGYGNGLAIQNHTNKQITDVHPNSIIL